MLEARGLTKHYSYLTAVRQVSFAIRPGEILVASFAQLDLARLRL